ncbi:MAG: flagellar motor switch protein FliN [Rhodospirillaceae bacterium]|jgi:flagellar motor switch protein FliN/FliY|nr:flagellar motor switch protein FliN [Gammaproteobacteria bacterium]
MADDNKDDVLLNSGKDNSDEEFEGIPFEKLNLDNELLQNIPVSISVMVGKTSLPIKALMRLTQGSVIELDRLAGEPLDLMVNNTLVAQGEIVLVNEKYGIRLTQIVPKSARLDSIKE